ncbi:hypothetical protein W97_02169 [Coniosporium apollinis CBS 100218]|uniref:Transformation/transcription domain-associated protein n=1 Tax=Coniosporium apollinis (strain CBS 100218) TaxID=1168221 RepID=R7YM46_CONA1|nr:uncharacterized protein W97_02169 [Coniosporium apollinis CBS 100218]EON62943.1 hypothetical protein W97_02169 [Coniosporium apollinis CBS 100218]
MGSEREASSMLLTCRNTDFKTKCSFAIELRDNIELWCQPATYGVFLEKFVPIFLKLLDGPPVFLSTSPEQRLRNCVLEILHRLPMTPPEPSEPYAAQIVDKLMELVKTENEDNAVLCMKTIMDFQRHHTKALADRVQPFLSLIQEMFEMMEQAVKDTFDNPTQQHASQAVPSTPSGAQYSQSPRPGSPVASVSDAGSEGQARMLLKGMQSFKVLAECPIIVVSIFQAYRRAVPENVKKFVPLIKQVLMLQAKPQQKAHEEAAAQGKVFTGVAKEIKNRAAFGEFITAQVKTMSFLAYLLRVYSQQLNDFLPSMPGIVVRLLKDCPREKSGARKELLVAIRHIINFNFRKIFLPKIDELLDERTLIGDGLTVYESMRPLAYSMLADLIHHLRDQLSKEQIRKTIEVYTRNLHDNYPGTSFQTMSAKLLMNMAECIAALEPKQDARYFLVMILNAIGEKFASMNRQFHNAVKLSATYSQPSIEATPENFLADKDNPPDWDEIDIFSATPIKTQNPRERNSDPIADNKFLFRNLLHGLKNLFYRLRDCNPPHIKEEIDAAVAPPNWHEVSFGYNAEEVEVLITLFREGAQVFRYYGLDKPLAETQQLSQSELLANQHMMSSGKEEKDLLETFATVFHHIDPATFHEVFQSQIPNLYEMMFDHPALLHVPQFLLASEATSPSFAGMLLQFLMGKMDEVGSADEKKSSILLRLFKLSFMAVTLFSTQNEQVLLPHVTKIVTQSIQLATTAEEPSNYFLLLRSLFRSIGGGRFEHLYKEILPLLEMLLEVLNNLLLSARKPLDRDLFVELILTVPARLSNLLPHLSYLMRPLVVALRAGSDLVGQGLRTLELCVDNLTADYLDPIMAPVIDELMAALWEHLKPSPYSHFHSHTTMRILGKLGGRNRKFLDGPPELNFKPYTDDDPSVDLRLLGSSKDRAFPAHIGIDVAISKLSEISKPPAKKNDIFHKHQALNLITAHTKLLVGFDSLPDDFAQLVRLQAQDLIDKKVDAAVDIFVVQDRASSIPKKDSQEETLKKLLKALVLGMSIPELKAEASSFMSDICRHFVLLEIGRALTELRHTLKPPPFNIKSGEGPLFVDYRVVTHAIADSLSSDEVAIREAAEEVIISIHKVAALILGSADNVENLPLFEHLYKAFTHNCYVEEWFMKSGGTLGIEVMISKLNFSDAWLIEKQLVLARSLMYVIKDTPQNLTARTRQHAQDILETLLRRCNKSASRDDLHNDKSKLFQLCAFLAAELSHMNRHVRIAAQKAFDIISQETGIEVHELISPVKERLLGPIFNKPLRALPFAAQIGYIDAITYCLKIRHNIVEFNEQLTRLVMEALALADAEDEGLIPKPLEQRNAEGIINLRIACIRLLSTAQSFPDFVSAPGGINTWHRIIQVFFKALYSKSLEVIEAAHDGLRGILSAQSKLPKDILQQGLRPILVDLQDPRKLRVEGLDGLARLLKLLTNYFKVEIGARLLEHMKQLADPAILQKVSFTLVEQNKQMRVITAIFNIFHLLPAAAVSFMKPLVTRVMELETALRRTHYSPFREPLIKFLNQYPDKAWEYFAPQLKDINTGRFFAQLLANPASTRLREAFTKDAQGFLDAFATEDEDERWPAVINAVHAAHSVSKHDAHKAWLVSNENVRVALFNASKALETKLRQNTLESSLRLAAEQAGDQATEVFACYFEQAPQDLDFFFEVVEAVTAEELKTCPALFDFIYNHMISNASVDYQRTLVVRCLDLYTARSPSQRTKTFVFHYIVNPILAMDVMRNWDQVIENAKGTKLVDRSLIQVITDKLWLPQSISDISEGADQLGVDHSRMELLQLTTLLMKYHHNLIQDKRKDIIKTGWNFIKLEDVINKHAAYVSLAYFMAHYETPPKIARPVYQQLLKAHQGECRALVMQALELLAPVLQKRIGGADAKLPIWAQIPRKILTEESSNLQQLTSIFNFIVRHPDLFYEAREPFAQIIIPSLSKIAAPPSQSIDGKKTAINLISLIWQWEHRTYLEATSAERMSVSPQAAKRRADGTVGAPAPTTTPRAFVAPGPMRLALISYLVKFIITLPERYPTASLKLKETTLGQPVQPGQSTEACRKTLQLLHDLLSGPYWSDLDVDPLLQRTEQVLTAEPKADEKQEVAMTRLINTLQVVKVILNVRPNDWILVRVGKLQHLLEKPLRNENPEVQDCLHSVETDETGNVTLQPLVKRIVDSLPESPPEEEASTEESTPSDFVTFANTVVAEGLSNGNYVSAINLLGSLCERRHAELDQHIQPVMKVLQSKLTKDHLLFYSGIPTQPGMPPTQRPEGSPDPYEHEIQTGLILKLCDMLAARISQLNDQRRPFLSVLAQLVERSHHNGICTKVLDLIEYWVFKSTEPVPTLKEKTAVLGKMLVFESRADTTHLNRFLDLIIRIYEDQRITRTELTVRMEHAFLIGTRAQDVDMRNRFMSIFDKSLSKSAASRLNYVMTSQNWDQLHENFWLSQVIQLMFGTLDMNTTAQLHHEDFKVLPASLLFSPYAKDPRIGDLMIDDKYESLVSAHKAFCKQLSEVRTRDILEPLTYLQHTSADLAHDIWIAFFPLCWSALSRDDQVDLEKGMVSMLTRDYHIRQIDRRPNCVQTIIEAAVRTKPRFKFPPHVLKYLARTFNAWYTAAHYLEQSAISPIMDTPQVRESNLDALLEIYSSLQEDDLFYGTWRRRCQYIETNAALSYEQNGMWDQAQKAYEQAQIKARTGALPFSQGEYMLWEDHWVVCAQKLQQWEILSDFAKHENFNDLYLESTWRNFDAWSNAEQREQLDQIIKAVADAPTPRRAFFQSFMALLKVHSGTETPLDFNRIVDEAVQLSIRKWHQLPKRITNAHIPLLQNFQQLIELHDASAICTSLAQTNQTNLDTRSQELKLLLSTWRDRLPNFWDDINAWQELVTWRQHIFHLINAKYLHLIQPQQGNAAGNSYAYRGYHETAWIINRFAHVARKHKLPDVCISQLSRIYTLPNIEIQEAFLKLREQAKCHYQNPNELNNGLDVINNTNLNYFGQQQKAEFYTLKGMFLAKLGQKEEANDAFGSALYIDIKVAKAWAEWGRYNDGLFKEDPTNLEKAASAISCYLEAASQYKNAKSRKLLGRILWLLSLDNADRLLAKTFDQFKGDTPIWYWITYIPQLLLSLSRPEAPIARHILSKLAKAYPQALYFQLRTSREDQMAIKRQADQKDARDKAARAKQGQPDGSPNGTQDSAGNPSTTPKVEPNGQPAANGDSGEPPVPKKPWEYFEELNAALKTAFPLLALSMETMVDQIQKQSARSPDEDTYRLIVLLFGDAVNATSRSPAAYGTDARLPPPTQAHLVRFSDSQVPVPFREAFKADFIAAKPMMVEYITKLRRWRARLEERLDHRKKQQHLETTNSHLTDFRFSKFDDVEVPGQYLHHRDKNQDFVRIERFVPDVEFDRGPGTTTRRLRIRGHDGSTHIFAIQHPVPKNPRREERIQQLFRIFNSVLAKRKESRRRNLQFHLPLMIPLSPLFRMVQDDPSYTTLQGIFEDHCRRTGVDKDEPVLFTIEKLRALQPVYITYRLSPPKFANEDDQRNYEQACAIRLETFHAIQEKWVPQTVVLDFFRATYPTFDDFWLFRRAFSYELAALSFMTFIMFVGARTPSKMFISRRTGRVWGSEVYPTMASTKPLFHNQEQVPFRLTPNLQTLMGPLATEGIFAPAMQAIARCLTEPEGELEMQLSIFVRDEMSFWYTSQHKSNALDGALRESVQMNSEKIVKMARSLADTPTQGNLPANQTVVDRVADATNPGKLSQTDPLWMAYL